MTTPDTATRTRPPTRGRRLPGDVDMWVMILGDLFIFGGYFVTYMVFRAVSTEEFTAAQRHLSVGIGVTNTVVLLTSSLFAALAVIAVREGALRNAQRLLWATGACGALFTLIKAYEWHAEISRGYTISDEFFSFYYVLTGVHLVHVAFGLIFLGVAVRELRNPRRRRPAIVEQSVLFWHMIDLLWVVIFALLYLMR
ncbi:cytochrome c oxidase subunit 3 family protein [Actinomadura craniellae]|uniref:Cytochrome aa3 subunit 3 n=1 Tax=Actinomadura craniellae TaxID=2231787 RepID=A0A365GVH0_9ACTN|nr:cytochrome c oxidase subunit 3 [Actinomadura craniellae]RAY10801.1 cytochrome c oxidase subunit 3 family protein [Actinomadura craniellae]